MTFIISYISENGISIASDSNITLVKRYNFRVKSEIFEKTRFYNNYKFGISIWGNLKIENKDIWDFIDLMIDEFFKRYSKNDFERFPYFLADKLNHSMNNHTKKLGIYFSTFVSFNGKLIPVLFHITNDRKSNLFIAQPEIHPKNHNPPYMNLMEHLNHFHMDSIHLRNISKKHPIYSKI